MAGIQIGSPQLGELAGPEPGSTSGQELCPVPEVDDQDAGSDGVAGQSADGHVVDRFPA